MHVYTVYKYQKDWEMTPFSFLIGAAFAGGSLKSKLHHVIASFIVSQILFYDFTTPRSLVHSNSRSHAQAAGRHDLSRSHSGLVPPFRALVSVFKMGL